MADDSAGSSFTISVRRFQGTVFGCLAGYVIVKLCDDEYFWRTVMCAVWVALCTFVRCSPPHAHAATVATFTANLLVLFTL